MPRRPRPRPPCPSCSHGVWRLSDSGLLRGEVEDLQGACEAALATANASLATLEERGGDIAGAQLRCASVRAAGRAGREGAANSCLFL